MGRGRFCWLFLQEIKRGSGLMLLGRCEIMNLKTLFLSEEPIREEGSFSAGCSADCLIVPSLPGPPHLESDKRRFESSLWLRHRVR